MAQHSIIDRVIPSVLRGDSREQAAASGGTDSAFGRFAPTVLRIYRRDKEAFWAAVMAPFLANTSLTVLWRHRRVGVELFAAFQGLDEAIRQTLRDFSRPLGIDVTAWKSNRPGYLADAYPVFAFLAIWMAEEGLDDLVERFADILRAGAFAVAGYGILDVNVDSARPTPVEILTAQALIAEYERRALEIFGVTPVNLGVLHKMRSIYLGAEIREKALRGIASPYHRDDPAASGLKGANAVTPYMLCLERLGKARLIDDYWQVFLLFGAAIQVIDDWNDLEQDLRVGHYSSVTLGADLRHAPRRARALARRLRADTERVRASYAGSKAMIAQSRAILAQLGDPFLGRMVDVTELRLDTYFRKELKLIEAGGGRR